MPPERLSWDRKDFFKERKYERPTPRWRESSSSSSGHYGYFSRWGGGGGSNDFRRPPGHGKQGGWHLFPEESGHGGHVPFRSNERILEDKNCRPSVSRGDGKYSRNSRGDNRGSFNGQRDWKNRPWEMSNGSPNMPGRLHDVSNDQRSVEDIAACPPTHPHPEFANPWDQLPSRYQHDNNSNIVINNNENSNSNNKMTGVNGSIMSQRGERENSLDWKPLKWTRSGSLSSRGSGFSHSSSSKSLGGADSGDGKTDVQTKKASLVQSSVGDGTACVTSVPSEDITARKKPRLNWGEGLAKYEKKKVEGPEVNGNKDASLISTSNGELIHLHSLNLVEKSPRAMSILECASPATPSSVACSSPGMEEKTSSKGIIAENDVSNSYRSPSVGSQSHIEDFSFNLEVLDATTMTNVSSSLVELLQYDDSSSVDSSFMRSTVMNKLLVLKGDISKALEVTESEIDSLENELKSLKFKSGSMYPGPATSSSPLAENSAKLGCEQGASYIDIPRPSPLQLSCSGAEHADKIPISNDVMVEVHGCTKDDDVDSPGTATSKFVEPMSMSKAISSLDVVKPDECFGVIDAVQTPTTVPGTDEENVGAPACRDASMSTEIKEGASFPSDMSFAEDNLCNSILAANKESAGRASGVFDNLLPRDHSNVDISEVCGFALSQNDAIVKGKFAMRKRFLRFKERVLVLKFKAFQKQWKEDMCLLSIKKYRAKPQKRCELGLRMMHGGHHKNRFSNRSRFSSPVGNLSVVPTMELLNFTSKLLSVSQVKHHRNALKMPALILDKKERVSSRFISSNGLVEDPWAVEKERAMINPWTWEEKEIFINKLAAFGKDFQKIASYLDHKTTADCVEFYYKNHKSDCFEKTKKSKQVKSSINYLVASGKNWDREMNAASLDILGAASVIAADADNAVGNHQMHSDKIYLAGFGDSRKLHVDDGNLDQVSKFDILENERETVAADVLAGICGSISSEAMSSCITSSIDPGEGCREWKSHKMSSFKKQPSTSDITQNNDEETCSDDSCGQMDPADWTDEEKAIFIRAITTYGKDFAKISRCVRTRSRDQCKVFFSKARKCLGLDTMHPALGYVGTPMSDDANGGESDTEDGCAAETFSIICSGRLDSRMDEGLPLHVAGIKQGESGTVEKKNLGTDIDTYEKNKVAGCELKVEKALASDACHEDGKPDLACLDDGKIMNTLVHQSDLTQSLEISNESISSEAEREKHVVGSLPVGNAIHPGSSKPVSVEVEAMVEVSGEGSGNQVKRMDVTVPENRLNGQIQDSNATSNTSHLPSDMGSSSNDSLGVERLHHVSVEFHSVEGPHIVSSQQENKLVTASTSVQDSSVIQCEKMHKPDRLSSQFDVLENRDEKREKFVGSDGHFQRFPGQSFINSGKSQQIHGVYPLRIPTKREMNGDISYMSRSEGQSLSSSERNGAIQFVTQDCYLQKCDNSKGQELPLLPSHTDNDLSRDRSRSLSDMEKPCRNGDVKLFGKILSNPSSSQKSNPVIHEKGEQGISGPKPSNKSTTLKFSNHQSTDGNASVLKFDRNNYLGLDVPVKSYGFWDGNKIQTGFSSIPPEYFLAKYPAAFSSFHMSTSKMEQHALQAAVKCNDGNLSSVSVLPPREAGGSNGVVDYQMYRSHDSNKLQQFSVEVKQRQDMLSEMQRLNGFEGMSSLQQQGRGMIGMNVVGRGGLVVGGVSDAVAALQMHYAKAEQQLGGQNGSILREEESWRSKGDLGR